MAAPNGQDSEERRDSVESSTCCQCTVWRHAFLIAALGIANPFRSVYDPLEWVFCSYHRSNSLPLASKLNRLPKGLPSSAQYITRDWLYWEQVMVSKTKSCLPGEVWKAFSRTSAFVFDSCTDRSWIGGMEPRALWVKSLKLS